ncbi:hypothetical protein KO317_02145 [Candidatus Micrarchaeota archaeon]|jgi:hypothetical protein|nr:hypothetical protein [Candidatus Micrarchaeota archaeon]
MQKRFGKTELNNFFNEIGENLSEKTTVYLLGGEAMCFRNQKSTTKDLDLLFKDSKSYNKFIQNLENLNFKKQNLISRVYINMEANSIWDHISGFRLDLFVGSVCHKLFLSDSMIQRSKLLKQYGNLNVYIMSNEDIILLKAVTERIDDTADIASITHSTEVNWEIVLEECEVQSKNRFWYGELLNKFYELKESFGINPQIIPKIEELYQNALIKDKINELKDKGYSKKQIKKELKDRRFTDSEIEGAF